MSTYDLRRIASLAAALPLMVMTSCSSSEQKPRGQVMLAISADMSVPENMNEIVVEVLDEQGNKQSLLFPIQPEALGKPLPGTIALVPPNSGGQRVRVRVIGQKNSGGSVTVRVVREAVVKVPTENTAMLTMPLRWLCDGEVETTADGSYKSKGCSDTETCVAGTCVPATFDGDQLPLYKPELVYGGGDEKGNGGTCLDVVPCFDKGVEVVPDSNCTVAMPTGASGVNVGMVPTASGQGHCKLGGDCFVPLDQDDNDGWKSLNGRINLPRTVCSKVGKSLRKLVVSTACETKSMKTPTCGPWTGVTQAVPVGAVTAPIAPGLTCTSTEISVGLLPSAQMVLLDASSSMAASSSAVQAALDAWQGNGTAWDKTLDVGAAILDGACPDPATVQVPIAPGAGAATLSNLYASSPFALDLPLDGALSAAQSAVSQWRLSNRDSLASVTLVTGGSSTCTWTTAPDMAGTLLTAEHAQTQVITLGTATPQLDQIASLGGTSQSVAASGTTLAAALQAATQGVLDHCRVRLQGSPSSVTLRSTSGNKSLAYYGAGPCRGPGYTRDPYGSAEVFELCPTECAQMRSGWALVCSHPTQALPGTGGTSGGTGGSAADAGAGGFTAGTDAGVGLGGAGGAGGTITDAGASG